MGSPRSALGSSNSTRFAALRDGTWSTFCGALVTPRCPRTTRAKRVRSSTAFDPSSNRSKSLAVEDGFDVVAVGIEHERAVVVGVVVRADAGGAVVFAAGFDRGGVE